MNADAASVLLLASAVVLLASVVATFVARARLWGARLRPAIPTATPPVEPLLYASCRLRGRHSELVPVLADWSLRGVLRIDRIGPNLAASRRSHASLGPVWRFTVGKAVVSLTSAEGVLLVAMFGHVPRPGESITVERDDVEWRERVQTAIVAAGNAQRDAFGASPTRYGWLRALLVMLVLASGLGVLIGAAVEWQNALSALAVLFVVVPVVVTVAVLVAVWPSKSAAERRYLQQVGDLGAWIRTTDSPIRELGGWAMIWDIPEPWPSVLPPEVAGLLHMDRSFLRGDFADTVPTPYTG